MQSKTAKQLLESQNLFYVLDSSTIKLNLSWKNKCHLYELECKMCNAIYSDYIVTNNFSGARKSTSEEYTFLTCKNCGSCQNDKGNIYKKKTYRDYTAGDVPYPNKVFKRTKGYVFKVDKDGNLPEIDEAITKLSCYKETPEVSGPEEMGGSSKKLEKPNDLFLCVTDALIASGLNPYESLKRKKLVEFYAKTPNVTHHDYAAFNSTHNKEKRAAEKAAVDLIDKSVLTKAIAKDAKFGDAKDIFAIESLEETLSVLLPKISKPEGERVDLPCYKDVTTTITEDGRVRLERKDGCVKTGVILKDGTIVEDKEPTLEEEKSNLDDDQKRLLQSHINKTTGCKSEVNIHTYLDGVFPDYLPQGTTSVSGNVDGIHLYGFIDAVSGKKGSAPKAIIEIKKRMNKIFTIEELREKKYDLCQLILYKILTQKRYPDAKPSLFIVQSFGEDISVERVSIDIQKEIYALYKKGIEEFKREIEEWE